MSSEQGYNTIVIGGGQAGLAAGYYLKQKGLDFVILDENRTTGHSWRKRWDSLRLFTPTQNNHLPGMKFPRPDTYFPTKDETADYLESYARYFGLPVRLGVKVDSLQRDSQSYKLSAGEDNFYAQNVIIATGSFRTPYTPASARGLSKSIMQMHSTDYRNPSDVLVKNVLVVGAGNSGVEIAIELANAGKKTWLAGRDVGRIPADKLGRFFNGRPYWWFMRRVVTTHTPLGRRMKANVLHHGNPLIRNKREEAVASGVKLLPRLTSIWHEIPHTEDGQAIAAEGIVWATGFRPDYRWIQLPIFTAEGWPEHQRGVVSKAHGVYFLGLHFQTGLTSALLGGVGEDARYITGKIL
jgi:putative flavoprotein involved in K+ transport